MLSFHNQRLLVVAPHPDDEVIGCGGLIKKLKDAGSKVYVLFLTNGDTKDFTKRGFSSGAVREKEIEKVAKYLKFDAWDIAFGGNDHHLRLDLLGQKALMDVIERDSSVSVEKVKPTIIAFPSPTSYNQDHRIAAQASFAATRPAPSTNKHLVRVVLSYEEAADSWSQEPSQAINFFVPLIGGEIAAKMKALQIYKSQLREAVNLRSPDSMKILAMVRGRVCGQEFAEGFHLVRLISE